MQAVTNPAEGGPKPMVHIVWGIDGSLWKILRSYILCMLVNRSKVNTFISAVSVETTKAPAWCSKPQLAKPKPKQFSMWIRKRGNRDLLAGKSQSNCFAGLLQVNARSGRRLAEGRWRPKTAEPIRKTSRIWSANPEENLRNARIPGLTRIRLIWQITHRHTPYWECKACQISYRKDVPPNRLRSYSNWTKSRACCGNNDEHLSIFVRFHLQCLNSTTSLCLHLDGSCTQHPVLKQNENNFPEQECSHSLTCIHTNGEGKIYLESFNVIVTLKWLLACYHFTLLCYYQLDTPLKQCCHVGQCFNDVHGRNHEDPCKLSKTPQIQKPKHERHRVGLVIARTV